MQNWQLFYYRGGAWSNALSSGTTTGTPQTVGGLPPVAARIPEGVRLRLTLAPGSALAGDLTLDWVNPINGGNKS